LQGITVDSILKKNRSGSSTMRSCSIARPGFTEETPASKGDLKTQQFAFLPPVHAIHNYRSDSSRSRCRNSNAILQSSCDKGIPEFIGQEQEGFRMVSWMTSQVFLYFIGIISFVHNDRHKRNSPEPYLVQSESRNNGEVLRLNLEYLLFNILPCNTHIDFTNGVPLINLETLASVITTYKEDQRNGMQ